MENFLEGLRPAEIKIVSRYHACTDVIGKKDWRNSLDEIVQIQDLLRQRLLNPRIVTP
jgi:hypothetical protein